MNIVDYQTTHITNKIRCSFSGLVSLIFGSITLIFFILIQMRVYSAYSNNVQVDSSSALNYCQSSIINGALAMIILTYISIVLFIGIFVILLKRKQMQTKNIDVELVVAGTNVRL
jgi:hypothetical protein